MPYSQQIEKLLRRRNVEAMTASEMAQKLGVSDDEAPVFQTNLDTLEYAGKLARMKGNRYALASRAGVVIGRLDVTRSGYGFVVPLDRSECPQDIFITQRDMGSATEGDLVAAAILKGRARQGQPSGKVSYVVRRNRTNFVGTYDTETGEGRVLVDGGGVIREIRVPRRGDVEAQPGEKVVVRVESWPRAGERASGTVIEALGPSEDPTTDTVAVIREFALKDEFPPEVMEEAERTGDVVREEDLAGRLDLRKRTVITIDPVHARDFDDAISIKRTSDGWLLGVHIADVSQYVTPGSALDREAAERGTSVYLPTKVIPMLPHSISNGLASLRENEDRLTKSVIMRYNSRGEILGYEIHRSVIRSAKRMTYEQAAEVLAGGEPHGIKLEPEVRELLNEAAQLARILEKRRLEAGMLELDMPEVEVEVDARGEVTGVKPVTRDWSHKLIEMFMIAANEVVAEFMTARKLPHLRRGHEGPSDEDLQALKLFLSGMGFVIRDTSNRYQLQEILKRAEGRPESALINLAVLKSMRRAEYTAEEKGHYALASAQYSHYTSPIRRFPDLVLHQTLDEFLTGRLDQERKRWWALRIPQIALAASQSERRADEAEKELTKLKVLRYLEKQPPKDYDGIVTGVKPFGIFIELTGLIVEGFVHVSELPDRRMRFDLKGKCLVGAKKGSSIRLGDKVTVRIKAIDLASRKLDLALVARPLDAPPRRRP
jgi:ribonuclease R